MLPKGGIFGSEKAWKKHVDGLSHEAKEELRKNNKWLLEQLNDPKNKVTARTKPLKCDISVEMLKDLGEYKPINIEEVLLEEMEKQLEMENPFDIFKDVGKGTTKGILR